jgi:two-component system response regulator YesN
MPFMNGLELSERIREKLSTTRIIILTGFDEFEYAKKAIKLNVVEYALKPISADELIEVLIRVKGKLDDEMAQRKDIEMLKENYRKSLPVLREKFLGSLITNRLSKGDILERAYNYGLRLNCNGFIVSVIRLDSDIRIENLSGVGCVSSSDNRELIKLAILNMTEEISNKYGSGIIFLHNDNIVAIFTSEVDDKNELIGKVLSMLEELRQSIEKYYKITATFGVGAYCNDITNISYSFESAITALDYRVIFKSNSIICIEDLEPKVVENIVFDELRSRSLICCIKVGAPSEIEETINELFKEIIDGNVSFKDYQIYLLDILTTILKTARDLFIDMDKIFGPNYNLFVEMYKFKDIRRVKEWLINICTKMKGYVSKDRQDTCKFIVKKATEYIENFYYDSELTIDKMCKYLHVSPTYFSNIFKRETRFTFINYLTHIRMEAAKELLRTTNCKGFEIAKRVGYSEPNYFSYCFKKSFSISPSEYRKDFKSN